MTRKFLKLHSLRGESLYICADDIQTIYLYDDEDTGTVSTAVQLFNAEDDFYGIRETPDQVYELIQQL